MKLYGLAIKTEYLHFDECFVSVCHKLFQTTGEASRYMKKWKKTLLGEKSGLSTELDPNGRWCITILDFYLDISN